MIRDLVEAGVSLVREERQKEVQPRADELAEERLLDLLLPGSRDSTREKLRGMLRAGGLDDRTVEVDVQERAAPTMQIFGSQGMEEMGLNLQEMLGNLPFGRKSKKRKLSVPEARRGLAQDEAGEVVDKDTVARGALERGRSEGVVLIDEIGQGGTPAGEAHRP